MGAQLRSDVSYSIMWSVHAMCRVTRAHAAAFNGTRQVGVDQPIWSELRTIEQAKEFATKVGCLPHATHLYAPYPALTSLRVDDSPPLVAMYAKCPRTCPTPSPAQ